MKKFLYKNFPKNFNLSFIGGGNMTQALTKGLIKSKLIQPSQIIVSDPNRSQHLFFRDLGIKTTQCNIIATTNQNLVIFAIKPQVLNDVFFELNKQKFNKSLVLSVIAGIKSDIFISKLNLDKVIRIMPNTPCLIGEGMSVWYPFNCERKDEIITRKILMSLGKEIKAEKESFIDMATALSGTGPSYIYLLTESMIDSGVHLGLSRDMSRKMVEQTIKGSIEYLIKSNKHPVVLRNEITSPGGTSASAMYSLEKDGFRFTISKSILEAFKRAKEISD